MEEIQGLTDLQLQEADEEKERILAQLQELEKKVGKTGRKPRECLLPGPCSQRGRSWDGSDPRAPPAAPPWTWSLGRGAGGWEQGSWERGAGEDWRGGAEVPLGCFASFYTPCQTGHICGALLFSSSLSFLIPWPLFKLLQSRLSPCSPCHALFNSEVAPSASEVTSWDVPLWSWPLAVSTLTLTAFQPYGRSQCLSPTAPGVWLSCLYFLPCPT